MASHVKWYFLAIYIITLNLIEGYYFNGGTITYKVLGTYDSIVSISITQTYFYSKPHVPCNDNKISRKISLFGSSKRLESWATLNCTQYCNQSDGYEPIPVDSFCTYYSNALNITVGQRSDIINITNGSYFLITFKGKAWRPLNTANRMLRAGNWSIPCLINLQIRSKGKYNHPPVVTMISPVYIPAGIQKQIFIPVIDADGDEIQCRFAQGPDECGSACYPTTLPPGTILESRCILVITGKNVGDWYAATIMIEDFDNSTSKIPLSSISVQFLINVYNEPDNCSQPELTGPVEAGEDQCVGFLVNQSRSVQLEVKYDCSNSTTIKDIAILSFPNVIKEEITQTTPSLWSVSLVWTPSVVQVGSQVLCAVAMYSNNVKSNLYCMKLTVAEGNIFPCRVERIMSTTEPTALDSASMLTTIDNMSEKLFTSPYNNQVSIDMTTLPTVDLQQNTTMAPSIIDDEQNTTTAPSIINVEQNTTMVPSIIDDEQTSTTTPSIIDDKQNTTTTPSIIDDKQTTTTPLTTTTKTTTTSITTNVQKSLSTLEPTDSNETSLTNISSSMPVTPSLDDQQMTSISDQENDFTDSGIIPSSTDPSSRWRWVAPLIALVSIALIVCLVVCCAYHQSWCCFKHRQRRSPRKVNTQPNRIIYPPKRSYKVNKAFQNKKNSHVDNLRDSLNNINKRTAKVTPTSTPPPPPFNNVQPHTPTAVTESYIFGGRNALVINK